MTNRRSFFKAIAAVATSVCLPQTSEPEIQEIQEPRRELKAYWSEEAERDLRAFMHKEIVIEIDREIMLSLRAYC